ncbi:hypothetical protein AWB81_07475 [Caballeronia arationis]|jgi:hypothetical protein|uniref:hypothetical protein n=1 Tax=Caballeronia arationis TaxID=1777142 RepID=UPI00074D18EB|nr:hypothetical protein [Caballeronia arationis]SAL06171.1 hypothetical protein AWB81_07475 [Caballeronia arationis]
MSELSEIKVERQAGGWVWAIVSARAGGAKSVFLRQSSEAFPTEEAALHNAAKALQEQRVAPPGGDSA